MFFFCEGIIQKDKAATYSLLFLSGFLLFLFSFISVQQFNRAAPYSASFMGTLYTSGSPSMPQGGADPAFR
jgi:hypothetical protein